MKITVLGSTGSIGVNTLDVVRQHPHGWKIHSLVAGRNLEVLCSQILEFHPERVVVADEVTLHELRSRLQDLTLPMKGWPDLAAGPRARVEAATASEVGFVMSAIVGVAGLEATYAAVKARKRIGLANKEVLVASGGLVMLFRWAWALALAAVFLLVVYNLWIFSTLHQGAALVQGLLNLVFFLYLVRPEVREKLR